MLKSMMRSMVALMIAACAQASSAMGQDFTDLHFGVGAHDITQTLVLRNDSIVRGEGIGVTVLRPSRSLADMVTNADTSGGNANVTISNLTIDCQNNSDYAIRLIRTAKVTLRDVRVINCRRDGIRLSGQGQPTRGFSLIGVEAENNGADGINVLWAMRDGRYDSLYAAGNGRNGVTFDHSEFTANNIVARNNNGNGIFLRNLFSTSLNNLTSTHNGGHGILVQGWVASVGTGWRAQGNSQRTEGGFDEIHFTADASLSYGATRDSVLAGLVTQYYPDLGVPLRARQGIYVQPGTGTLRLVGGVGDEGPHKIMCHQCCEADLARNIDLDNITP